MMPRIQTFTWLPLFDLPKVPKHFVERARALTQLPATDQEENLLIDKYQAHTQEYKYRKLTKDGKEINTLCQEAQLMGDDWEQWVSSNIWSGTWIDTAVRASFGNSTVHGPHVDNQPGKFKLNYIIDNGGDDAETVFYHKLGDPYVYDPDIDPSDVPIHHNNLDELEVVERSQLPSDTWILLNGFFMHGVENVTGLRRQLSVSVRPEDLVFNISPKG